MLTAVLLALLACAPRPTTLAEGVELTVAFPGLPRFERPLWFGPLGASETLHAVVEQTGRIHVFEALPDGTPERPTVFLDLSRAVSRIGNEEGLLGLAFHPRYEENGRLFVHYSLAGARRGRVSELRRDGQDARRADPASERILLEVDQPHRNHNGGHLLFGPDGLLYIGLGDGGGAGDPERTAQDPASLLGSILRIDVERADPGLAYAIPPDNPFADVPGARGELFAIGLRNPWRFAFDPATDLLWVGDVGELSYEEVSVLSAGQNGGWPLFEGRAPFAPGARRGPGELVEPVWVYGRRFGVSITGGLVQRGGSVPALRDRYVFADYGSGRVATLAADDPGQPAVELARVPSPTHFGLDGRGELCVTSFDGRIYRFATP